MSEPINRDELLQQVKTAVQSIMPTAEIILYGSQARGTATPESDWDFLVLLPTPADKWLQAELKDRIYDVELATDTVLSTVVRSQQEWHSARYTVVPLHQQIERDGVRL
jgi:uncharacterized protein